VRVNNASDWLSAREAARIDLGAVSPAVTGEKLAADRNRRVFGMRSEAVIALLWGRCLRRCSGEKLAADRNRRVFGCHLNATALH
jgi:hypothetical protein